MNAGDPLVVRDAERADVGFIVAANVAMALETEAKVLDPVCLERGVGGVIGAPERGFYLVAERAGERLGCLLVTREWSDWRNGDWWWLQSVYVMPAARRGGVFRALHAEVEHRCSVVSGVVGLRLYVERDNRVALATYAALGLVETPYTMLERAAGRSGPAT